MPATGTTGRNLTFQPGSGSLGPLRTGAVGSGPPLEACSDVPRPRNKQGAEATTVPGMETVAADTRAWGTDGEKGCSP